MRRPWSRPSSAFRRHKPSAELRKSGTFHFKEAGLLFSAASVKPPEPMTGPADLEALAGIGRPELGSVIRQPADGRTGFVNAGAVREKADDRH